MLSRIQDFPVLCHKRSLPGNRVCISLALQIAIRFLNRIGIDRQSGRQFADRRQLLVCRKRICDNQLPKAILDLFINRFGVPVI